MNKEKKLNIDEDRTTIVENQVNIFSLVYNFLLKNFTKLINNLYILYNYLKSINVKNLPNQGILVLIFFIYSISIFLLYFMNPYNLFDYTRGWEILLIVLLGGFFVSLSMSNNISNLSGLKKNIMLFFKLIGIVIVLVFGLNILFNSLKYLGNIKDGISGLLKIGLVIFLLCGIFFLFKEQLTSDQLSLLNKILVKIVFFIPCLINDLFKGFMNDVGNTPKISFLIIFVIVIVLVINFLVPKILKSSTLHNGRVLLDKPLYLNEEHLIISNEKLGNRLYSNPSNKFKKMIYDFYNNYFASKENFEIKGSDKFVTDKNKDMVGEILDKRSKKNKLFRDLSKQLRPEDLKLYSYKENRFHDFGDNIVDLTIKNDGVITIDNLNQTKPDIKSLRLFLKNNKDVKLNKESIDSLKSYLVNHFKNTYKDYIEDSAPYPIKYTNDLVVDAYLNVSEKLDNVSKETIDPYMDYNFNKQFDNNKYDYNFGISMWVYIDSTSANVSSSYTKYTPIFNYGLKPTLLYNGIKNELIVQTQSCHEVSNEISCKPSTSFKTNSILYQKWNHIVINYNRGSLDVFINNNLVGTSQNVIPHMSYDNITVGSDNGIHGGICNLVYYKVPLSKSKIGIIYNLFKRSDPPILNINIDRSKMINYKK